VFLPLAPNTLLSTLLSKNPQPRKSLNVSDQVLHPYQTTGKIIALYISKFRFLDRKLEDKAFCTEWYDEIWILLRGCIKFVETAAANRCSYQHLNWFNQL
jgi:hypothetical protein